MKISWGDICIFFFLFLTNFCVSDIIIMQFPSPMYSNSNISSGDILLEIVRLPFTHLERYLLSSINLIATCAQGWKSSVFVIWVGLLFSDFVDLKNEYISAIKHFLTNPSYQDFVHLWTYSLWFRKPHTFKTQKEMGKNSLGDLFFFLLTLLEDAVTLISNVSFGPGYFLAQSMIFYSCEKFLNANLIVSIAAFYCFCVVTRDESTIISYTPKSIEARKKTNFWLCKIISNPLQLKIGGTLFCFGRKRGWKLEVGKDKSRNIQWNTKFTLSLSFGSFEVSTICMEQLVCCLRGIWNWPSGRHAKIPKHSSIVSFQAWASLLRQVNLPPYSSFERYLWSKLFKTSKMWHFFLLRNSKSF